MEKISVEEKEERDDTSRNPKIFPGLRKQDNIFINGRN